MRDDPEYAPVDDEHRSQVDAWAIANCEHCDDKGIRGMLVCDHVDHAAAARRGMEKIRELLGWDKL